jgi:hypothetical protein
MICYIYICIISLPSFSPLQICILFGDNDLSWENARSILRSKGFIDRLLEYKKEDLLKKEAIMAKVKPRLKEIDPIKVKDASQAAFAIISWLLAIDRWYDKAKIVQPKKVWDVGEGLFFFFLFVCNFSLNNLHFFSFFFRNE